MPSIPYMNQSAPFWDFVANLEQQPHPPFSNPQETGPNDEGAAGAAPAPPTCPWGWTRGMPFRGQAPQHEQEGEGPSDTEKNDNGEGSSDSAPQADKEGSHCGPKSHHGPHGHHGPRGHHGPPGPWGHCGGRRGRHHGRGGMGMGGHCGFGAPGGSAGFGGPPGPWGPRGFFNPMNFASFFEQNNASSTDETKDFEPGADIFDTESSFVIHVSLAGAKKEDVGVNWDPEKSELSIAGVVYRPGDEEFLKTLALGERKVGPFERKVRLGTRANPAQVDADMITAKLEDGVLRVEVPKLESDFVEVRKVDIQ